MASRIQICKDKAEAIRMAQAGVLLIKDRLAGWGTYPSKTARWVELTYGAALWPPEDFGYLVDDDG